MGWTEPVPAIADFAERNTSAQASTDGARLYFESARREPAIAEREDVDLWVAERVGDGWGRARPLGAPFDSPHNEHNVTIAPFIDADERFVIFASNRPGGAGAFDLYISHQRDGAWQPAVSLGPTVNTAASESNPALSPDRERLLFSRTVGERVVLHEMRFDPRWLEPRP